MSTLALIAAFAAFLSSGSVGTHTTLYFDQQSNITPRVIDQSIKDAVAAIHASELNPASEKRNLEQLEVHCTRSLIAAGLGQYAEKCDLN